MVMISIRNLSDEAYRALEVRAKLNGRSVEAEACVILVGAIRSEQQVGMGDALMSLGRKIGLKNDDLGVFEQVPAEPMRFD